MEILIYLSVILLSSTLAIEVEETTTFPFDTTEPVTDSATNDDVTITGALTENSDAHSVDAVESKEELTALEKPVDVAFPHNHRNFTGNEFLGDDIRSPYYDRLSEYQQQYKAFLEQKQLFNRKPVKFEGNSVRNVYVPADDLEVRKPAFGYQVHEGKRQEAQRKPFPYAFEQSVVQEPHKNVVFDNALEEPKNELTWHGYQHLPQFIFPKGHFHEQKFYKTEPSTYEHQTTKKSKGNPWKKAFHLLTALVPLGLILASLTPNVISVNSTAVTKNMKQRSEDSLLPMRLNEADVTELMNEFGVKSLSEAQCEDRVICELGRRGEGGAASALEKGLWFLANETPWDAAEKAGMNELFKAIRTGTCELYKCYSSAKSTRELKSQKKPMRKRKILEKKSSERRN